MSTTRLLRAAFVLLLTAWLAVPSISSDTDGGENAGGTGVWILPACAGMTESIGSGPPRAVGELNHVTNGVFLRMPSQMASAAAVMTVHSSSTPASLPVIGSVVRIKQPIISTLAATGLMGKIMILDAQQQGYLVTISATQQSNGRYKVKLEAY